MEKNRSFQIGMLIVFGTLFCLLIGFFFYKEYIFRPGFVSFQFLVFGLSGSVFYALLMYRTIRISVLMLFTLYVLDLLLFQVTRPDVFLTHFLEFAVLGSTIYLYHVYIRGRFKRIRVGKFIFIAILFAALGIIVGLIYALVYPLPNTAFALVKILKLKLLIGVGLGLGLETAELLPVLHINDHQMMS